MPNHEPLTEVDAQRLLHGLDRVPPRSPDRAQRARAEFLERAGQLAPHARDMREPATVPARPPMRKGIPQMIPAIASLLLALGLVLGGGGTVFAAQDALPPDPLYPLKLLTEDAQIQMTGEEDARAALFLQFADRRIAELGALPLATPTVVEPVLARFQEQLNAAMRLAAEASDSELALRILARIQAQLEIQARAIASLQFEAGDQLRVREQLQTAVQQRLELCSLGEQNPDALRQQLHEQDQLRPQDRTQMPAGAGPQGDATPGANATGETYGPGPGGSGDAGSGSGDGEGSAYEWGPGEPGYGDGSLTPTPSATQMKKRHGN
jgi:hypothetical protein